MVLITFGAGLVRGFTGFALSAVVIGAAALFLPPVELIPLCWWLEITASLLMLKTGWQDANRTVVIALVTGSIIGVPIGTYLTVSMPQDISKLIALALVIGLAALQLARIRLAFLATRPGLFGSGLSAGIVTGLAGIGGMVIALYVLSQNAPARQMRASLVLFLLAGSVTSMLTYLAYGTMDAQAATRGLSFAIPTAAGVLLGKALFTPRFEPYYKRLCLMLLIALAGSGIIRLGL